MKKHVRLYRCSKCQRLYKRYSDKRWIKSWCTKTDKQARLMSVTRI